MKRIRRILFLGTFILTIIIMLLAGAALKIFPAGGAAGKALPALFLCLAAFPLLIHALLLRALNAYADQSQRYATRDPLTDLYNQNAFWDFLNYEIERSKRQQYRFSLLLVDIDHFKAVNDRYGHETGDLYLEHFSTVLKNAIRKGDIPARYAGDNFAAILPVCDEAQAHLVSRRILDSTREFSITAGGQQVRTTATIGIASFPDHAENAQDLYLLADSMLGQAKSQGKDRAAMPCEDVDINSLKSAGEKSIFVMEAIRERRIVPYFQPIISVDGKSILAYEVLTRVVLPDRVVTAAEFIDVAESMGAIAKINYLLMEQAFRTANESGYEGTLFINLSPRALVLNDFLPTVKSLLQEHDYAPSRIVFEITERDTVKNPAVIEGIVKALKQEGFRFAIDDFGSGYSTFQYIRLFEVDYLKVDGEFIRSMDGDRVMERAIVASIANLAGDLGIKTIAEYVESEAIMQHVRTSGIQYAQGYYIDRPSPSLRPLAARI